MNTPSQDSYDNERRGHILTKATRFAFFFVVNGRKLQFDE